MLRDDEQYVIERLVESFGGRWIEGENPPDAYLLIGERRISVEISTLVQLVAGRGGRPVSRMSQDAVPLRLTRSLSESLGPFFRGTRAVVVTFFAPIKNVQKFHVGLAAELERITAMKATPEEPLDFVSGSDLAVINVHDEWTPGHSRVAGAVLNRQSSADILANATQSLYERLSSKSAWSKAVQESESWLALLNAYDPLADADTYRQAMQEVNVEHNFDRILVVSGHGSVDTIFLRGDQG